ncbi:MAG TPA: transcriptional regulator, partial [Cyanobacteria bacterium UBA11049]|nr:transcriptional regulator [Cyanobacteria bacterium UBA11049]
YILAREPWKINLLEVLTCLDGLDAQASEPEANPKTVESAVVQEIWQEAQQAANLILQKYTLQALCEQRTARRQLDFMYYI